MNDRPVATPFVIWHFYCSRLQNLCVFVPPRSHSFTLENNIQSISMHSVAPKHSHWQWKFKEKHAHTNIYTRPLATPSSGSWNSVFVFKILLFQEQRKRHTNTPARIIQPYNQIKLIGLSRTQSQKTWNISGMLLRITRRRLHGISLLNRHIYCCGKY